MTATGRPRLCIYCGSRNGDDPAFVEAADRVGRLIGGRGADLVYGGGHVGLMGVVADAALESGSHVIGVITHQLADREVGHNGLSELRHVADMTVRKREMFDAADAFMTLPGGIGTMEELFEVLCWSYLGIHPKPVGILNVGGYYDHLIAFIDHSVERGLCQPRVSELLLADDDPERLLDRLLPDGVDDPAGEADLVAP